MALRTPLSVTPHLYMGDSTGRPLDKGVVYFGEQDKDPEFYPIELFSDDALTKPLMQPVHTKGGYLYDKGDMVEPHAKEIIYSVKVLDSYGRKVFYKGAMMRNSWNDDVIDRIGEGLIAAGDKAQVAFDVAAAKVTANAADAVSAAIEGVAIDANLVTDALIKTVPKKGGVARTQAQKNLEILTPFDFGGIGDGTTHKLSERYTSLTQAQEAYPHATSLDDEIDWCAIQAMFNIARTQEFKRHTLNWGGNWHLNKPVEYVSTRHDSNYKSVIGDFKFSVSENFVGDAVVILHGRGVNVQGVIVGNCDNRVLYGVILDRRKVGDAIDNISFGMKLDRVFINNCLLFAVKFNRHSMFSTLEFLRADNNGVGGKYGSSLTANVTAKTDTGVGTLTGKSVLQVDTLPPEYAEKEKIFIIIDGQVSRVTNIDRATSEITVLPNITKEGAELSYVYGGGVSVVGSDSANIHLKQVSVLGSGIGVDHSPMYPAVIGSLATEFCGIGFYEEGLVGGANLLEVYTEGNFLNYITGATSPQTYGSTSILHGTAPNFDKFDQVTYGRTLEGLPHALYAGLSGLSFKVGNEVHGKTLGKLPNNVLPTNVGRGLGVDFNTPHKTKVFKTNTVTIGFDVPKKEMNELFAYDSQQLEIVGTGENGRPTKVTFTPPLGYTLNGGATNTVFTGFSSSAKFTCFLNVTSKDITISCSTLSSRPSSTYTQLPTGVDLKDLPLDEIYWFFGSSQAGGETGIPLPSDGNAVNGTITKRYSHRPAAGSYNITQEVVYETKGEVWRRFYTSSSGNYGSWSLVRYTVQKGTTAQRPVNPTLGHRYYDTTLIPTGQPITWNGSSWVDGMGVVV